MLKGRTPWFIDPMVVIHLTDGGLGVAPIFPQARAFKQAGAYVIGVVGFRSKDLIFWEDKFRAACDEFYLCTDDGSAGIMGRITEGVKRAIEKHDDIDECESSILFGFCALLAGNVELADMYVS